ncbi:two-component system response regulator BtsR [Celerinatantimonas sp. YJH-8]|uniref:two-component system response regulator BtsR n=1 Tax=Celerinatantimonas sp. YJH-8 TaxID=3228714 RepID=UPI0038C69AB9
MFKAVIVDDEPLARDELKILLEQDDRFEIIAEFDNAVSCLSQLPNLAADVLFVDIQMPKLTGLDLLKIIPQKPRPFIVLITAYEDYALQAFEDAAFDYLLKPIDDERLKKTLHRLAQQLTPEPTSNQHLTLLPCFSHQQQQWIRCESVEYAFSDLSGVHIFDGQQQYHTQLTLKALEQQLGLVRCHRQYLINPGAIHAIAINDDGHALLTTISQSQIPVSRRYLKTLRELFALP